MYYIILEAIVSTDVCQSYRTCNSVWQMHNDFNTSVYKFVERRTESINKMLIICYQFYSTLKCIKRCSSTLIEDTFCKCHKCQTPGDYLKPRCHCLNAWLQVAYFLCHMMIVGKSSRELQSYLAIKSNV